MSKPVSAFRDTLKELLEAAPGAHPPADRWLAYQRGEVGEAEAEQLEEHLALCRDCFDLAAGAAAFAGPEETTAVEEAETALSWRELRERLEPAPALPRSTPARRQPVRGRRWPTTLAALFFLATVGLTVWNLRQRSTLQAPVANLSRVEIVAGERGSSQRERILPAGPVLLLLHPKDDLPAYRLEIRDTGSGALQVSKELRPDQDLTLSLYLPKGALPVGRYRLELSDTAGVVRDTEILRVEGD